MTDGKLPKKVIVDETLGDVEPSTGAELSAQRTAQFESKRGAKLLGPKPEGAFRVLVGGKPRSNRPFNIYKERVVDVDSGKEGWFLWWTTEQSDYEGKQEIVKFNPRTEEELPQGYDYLIPFTVEKAKDLIKRSFGASNFYLKDGEDTFVVKKFDLEKLFLKDHLPGLTPLPKTV